jgi:hypothetical protein
MSNDLKASRRISDYNEVFVKLAEADPQIVNLIESLGEQVADLAPFEEAVQELDQATPTGFVSALA